MSDDNLLSLCIEQSSQSPYVVLVQIEAREKWLNRRVASINRLTNRHAPNSPSFHSNTTMAATSNCSSSPSSSRSLNNIPFLDDHDQYQNIRGVLPTRSSGNYSIIGDNYNSLEEVAEALQQAGLESSNLIVGIDFTKSNEWTGGRCFGRKNLHFLGQDLNPYEQAISIIGRTLSTFDEDNLIPCYDFASTHDKDVFSFFPKDKPCRGFEELLSRYRELVPRINLSGTADILCSDH
ncbi:hypothetical protein F8388_015929 [Cannabis sativa]|uniref:Copine C-terminal domain-containing protein n=1 Tax=Cannabis sativa TaxID=3483 RepID=A0A7J6EEQ4_CANSA|nr:hypothetical protein F8388_015929 [Cannabis sativa]